MEMPESSEAEWRYSVHHEVSGLLLFSSSGEAITQTKSEEVIKETKAEGADLTEEHAPSLHSAEDESA